jgi:protein TonB
MLQATAVSVGLHVGLCVLVFVAVGPASTAPVPLPVYTVDLVDLPGDEGPPGGGAVASQPPPPEPEPEPEPSPMTAMEEEPPPPPPKPKPEPEPEPEPEPVRQEEERQPPRRPPAVTSQEPSTAQPDTEEGAAPGDAAGAGLAPSAGSAEGGVPTIDSDAFQFAYYRQILTNRLRSTWSRPLVPGGLQQPIRATVSFMVLRSGAITDVNLDAGSGYPPLDRSALRSVYDANPLPPLPDPYEGDRLAVNFYFELTPER